MKQEAAARLGAQSDMPVLSIAIVNSDSATLTTRCLASIFRHPPAGPFEVILVDNCSSVPILPQIVAQFPTVQVLAAPMRQGFAKNYNLAIAHASGAYVAILNSDTIVQAEAFDRMISWMRANQASAIVGPRLISATGRIQSVCARRLLTPLTYSFRLLFLDLGMPTGMIWERFSAWRITRRKSGPVPCISGACMVVSRELLDAIGPLDDAFDFYFEDVEWCHRAWRAGFQVGYVAEAQITHLGDQSLSKVKEWAKQSEFRSALRYFRMYHKLALWQAWLLWLVTAVSFFFRMVTFKLIELVSAHAGHSLTYWNLLKWIVHQYPKEQGVLS